MADLNGRKPKMDTTNYSEKRAYLRYSVGIKAGYVEDCAHSEIPTVTSNICEEGLCIVTKRLLLPGTDIDVVLRIKGNPEEIRRHGKVVWCKIVKPGEYHSGIHLEDKDLNSIDLVLRTIKAQRNY